MGSPRKRVEELTQNEVGAIGVEVTVDYLKEKMGWKLNRKMSGKEEQEYLGDVSMLNNGCQCAVEVKTERFEKFGNFFLETWSNRKFGRQNPGWMVKLKSDFLSYLFLGDGLLYLIPFPDLFKWFWGEEPDQAAIRRHGMRERNQTLTDQLNVTSGFPVNIAMLNREIPSIQFGYVKEIVARYVYLPDFEDSKATATITEPVKTRTLFDF